jgi:hypothetical protein
MDNGSDRNRMPHDVITVRPQHEAAILQRMLSQAVVFFAGLRFSLSSSSSRLRLFFLLSPAFLAFSHGAATSSAGDSDRL